MNDTRCDLMLSLFPTSLGWFGLLGDGDGKRDAADNQTDSITLTARESIGSPPTSKCLEFSNIALMICGTPARTKTFSMR